MKKMRTAAPREGQDHDTLLPGPAAVALIVLLAALTATSPAHHAAAQSQPCTAIQNDAERLACYDRALRATSPAPTAPAATASAPTSPAASAAQAPAAPVTQAPPPAAQAPATQPPAAQAPAAQAPAAPAAQASTATSASSANPDRVIPIVVVNVRALQGRETSFTTQDGATWVQTDSQRIYGLPDTPFDAELKPGAVGSTFLLPKSSNRAIRVKLVER
jgi:hypothetical protein